MAPTIQQLDKAVRALTEDGWDVETLKKFREFLLQLAEKQANLDELRISDLHMSLWLATEA